MRTRPIIASIAAACWSVSAAAAQDDPAQNAARAAGLYAPSVWDLTLGVHAFELPKDQFIDFACGTNGGPPSLTLTQWTDFANCVPEEDTAFFEVYFEYDDEPEYWAKALGLQSQIAVYSGTSAYEIPVIVSALFDGDGFLHGFRLVSDPRADLRSRENGISLSGFLYGRYGEEGWECTDLPHLEGEVEYQGHYEKRLCRKTDPDQGLTLMMETHFYRKLGQFAVNPRDNMPTEGHFESTTRFEATLTGGISHPEQRLAALVEPEPTEEDRMIEHARNCPGCDFRGVNLKRADLRNANLSGANLSGANLHGAILSGANLAGANLSKANVNRADLKRANLRGAVLQRAMLYESRLDGADLTGADLTAALAGNAQLIRATLNGATMLSVDLRNARLTEADFAGAYMAGAWLHDSQMARANFSGADLSNSLLIRASMVDVNLTQADVRGADMFGANLRGADLTLADLSYSRLTSANLADVVMEETLFIDAMLPIGFEPPFTARPAQP